MLGKVKSCSQKDFLSNAFVWSCYFGRYIRDNRRREHLDGNPVSIWSIWYDINLTPLLLRAHRPLLSPKLYAQSSHFRDWSCHTFYRTVARSERNSRGLLVKTPSLPDPAKIKERIFAMQSMHLYSFMRFTVTFITIIAKRDDIEIFPSLVVNRSF